MRRNGYYVAGGAITVCVLAALAGFDGGVGSDLGRGSGIAGASLGDGGLTTAAADVDGGTPLGAVAATPPSDTMRPTIVDAFPVETFVPGWSDVNATELRTRLTSTLEPLGVRVAGVECRQRSCYIDVQGPDVMVMMASRDVFFGTLSGLSVDSCQFGSLGLDEETVVQRLYLYCNPDRRPNFAYFDASLNVTESVARARETLARMNDGSTEDGT